MSCLKRKFKGNRKGKIKGNSENYKGKKGGREGGINVNGKPRCEVWFTDVVGDSPGNTAMSTYQTEMVSGENRAYFGDREVLIAETVSRRTDWLCNIRGGWGSKNDDCSRIIDTGFKGCSLCSFN